jgi:phosphoribosylanthranilate isomerase
VPTKVKICGIARPEDVRCVVDAGADALGLNFVQHSPRFIPPGLAREISAEVAGSVSRVGLFVDADAAEVEAVLRDVELDVLQFHGDEPGSYCEAFGVKYMKATRVRGPVDVAGLEAEYPNACCLLLDAFVPGLAGGTGVRLDLACWPERGAKPLVLAGGLTPDNVAEAIRAVRPFGVDVSSGVEGEVKGHKDPERVRKFVSEVRRVGREGF